MKLQGNTFYLSFGMVLFLCLLLGLGSGCVSKQEQQPSAIKVSQSSALYVPQLLERHAMIGTVEEQRKVTNIYSELKAALQVKPEDYRKRLQMAQLCMLEARATGEHGHYYPATLKILDHILIENPPKDVKFGALSLKASVQLSLHEFADAKETAKQAITINGYNALIYGVLVDAHVELGEYEQAVKMADKMVSIRPDLRSYARISYLREIHGDLTGAIEAMQMAVEAGYPGYEETAWAGLTLGELYKKSGALDKAEAQFQGILLQRPHYPFAIAALANVHQKQNLTHQAKAELMQAMEIIPEVSFYIDMAKIMKAEGKTQEVQQMVAEILEMLADDVANGHKMDLEYARLYLELLEQPEKALEYAKRAYEERPENIDVNQLMGAIYVYMDAPHTARPYVEKAARTGKIDAELKKLNETLETS
ncbi:MAG: hypothetical protein AAF135_05485 [Bacteroidota bacterium]